MTRLTHEWMQPAMVEGLATLSKPRSLEDKLQPDEVLLEELILGLVDRNPGKYDDLLELDVRRGCVQRAWERLQSYGYREPFEQIINAAKTTLQISLLEHTFSEQTPPQLTPFFDMLETAFLMTDYEADDSARAAKDFINKLSGIYKGRKEDKCRLLKEQIEKDVNKIQQDTKLVKDTSKQKIAQLQAVEAISETQKAEQAGEIARWEDKIASANGKEAAVKAVGIMVKDMLSKAPKFSLAPLFEWESVDSKDKVAVAACGDWAYDVVAACELLHDAKTLPATEFKAGEKWMEHDTSVSVVQKYKGDLEQIEAITIHNSNIEAALSIKSWYKRAGPYHLVASEHPAFSVVEKTRQHPELLSYLVGKIMDYKITDMTYESFNRFRQYLLVVSDALDHRVSWHLAEKLADINRQIYTANASMARLEKEQDRKLDSDDDAHWSVISAQNQAYFKQTSRHKEELKQLEGMRASLAMAIDRLADPRWGQLSRLPAVRAAYADPSQWEQQIHNCGQLLYWRPRIQTSRSSSFPTVLGTSEYRRTSTRFDTIKPDDIRAWAISKAIQQAIGKDGNIKARLAEKGLDYYPSTIPYIASSQLDMLRTDFPELVAESERIIEGLRQETGSEAIGDRIVDINKMISAGILRTDRDLWRIKVFHECCTHLRGIGNEIAQHTRQANRFKAAGDRIKEAAEDQQKLGKLKMIMNEAIRLGVPHVVNFETEDNLYMTSGPGYHGPHIRKNDIVLLPLIQARADIEKLYGENFDYYLDQCDAILHSYLY